MKYFILALLGVLLSNCQKQKNQSESVNKHSELTNWIKSTSDTSMIERHIPATAFSLIRDGEIVYKEGYGILNREKSKPVNSETIFQIASLTKTLTGIITHNLILENKLDVNQSVSYYLKDLISKSVQKKFKNMKVIHLIQHTAGFPNEGFSVYRNWQKNHFWTEGFSREQLINELDSITLGFPSGTKHEYSNSGYALLGLILEIASNKSAEQLVEDYIANPYGLKNTGTTISEEQRKRLARPYLPSNRYVGTTDSNWGYGLYSSGVYSTLTDITKLLLAQMNAYQEFENSGNMSPLVLTDIPDINNEPIQYDGHTYLYGMGLIKYDVAGKKIIYEHKGDSDGYGINYYFDLKRGLGVVHMTSSCGYDFQQLGAKIGAKLDSTNYIEPKRPLVSWLQYFAQKGEVQKGLDFFNRHKFSAGFYYLEEEINNLGYFLMQMDQLQEALVIFELNTQQFPESWNTFDSAGEAYLLAGNEEKAKEYYQKSLDLNPKNEVAKEFLKK